MKELSELMDEIKFSLKLNINKYLIGFENGIYDLDPEIKEQEHRFRPGKPEDYVSFSTGYNYIPFDEIKEHPIIRDIKDFFEQIFPDEEVRHYMLKYIASLFEGGNTEEKFLIFIGIGSNGKSKLKDLIDKTLGDYSTSMNISFFTQKRTASNNATPEVVDTMGCRFVYTDEPEKEAKLNAGLMKQWTGRDKIKGRALYSDTIEWENMAKTVLLCNDLPALPVIDSGVWRRVQVIRFVSKFIEDPIEDNEHPIDYDLEKKLRVWAEEGYFASYILSKYYPLYKSEGLKPPSLIRKWTDDYRSSLDTFHEFMKKAIERTGKVDDRVDCDELYQLFIDWWHSNYPGKKNTPSNKEFRNYVKNVYKNQYKEEEGFIYRFRIVENISPPTSISANSLIGGFDEEVDTSYM